MCEEILVSEMLTRVWSAVLAILDSQFGDSEAQPIAASVLAGHIEISNRVLGALTTDRYFSVSAIKDLNRLRRLTERWTDLLLGSLNDPRFTGAFAHNTDRAADFAEDFNCHQSVSTRQQSWLLLRASLYTTFARRLSEQAPNQDLNSRIAGAILACFPSEAFDSAGVYHSLWLQKLSATASDMQVLVAQISRRRNGKSQFPLPRQGGLG